VNWIREHLENIAFDIKNWWLDRPLKKFVRGIWLRINVVFFCIALLAVGLWSPVLFRAMMYDALKDSR
jgi:hypothetical protein